MGIVNRVSDIIQSNIVAVLEKAEDPKKLVNLMLNDMHEALNESKGAIASLLSEEKIINRQIESKKTELTTWQSKAELAVKNGRDEVARSALLSKQSVIESIENKQAQLKTLQQSLSKIRYDSDRLQQKIAAAKKKQAQLAQHHNAVKVTRRVSTELQSDKIVRTISRFEQIEHRVESIEAQVEAYDFTNNANSIATKVELLAKNEKIDTELAELKARINDTPSAQQRRGL